MKKLLLTLGSLAAVVAPVASVVACGNGTGTTPGTAGNAGSNLSSANTFDDLKTKVVALASTFGGIENSNTGIHINLVDGTRTLDVTILKGDSEDDSKAKYLKIVNFFKASLKARGVADADLQTKADELARAATGVKGTN